MRVVVSGAGGFVGRALIARLKGHEIIALDTAANAIPDQPGVTPIVGNIGDAAVLENAFSSGCDAVIHLASVPGGAAERNTRHARTVNIEASMELADVAARAGSTPRFVFASSIAALGEITTKHVTDATPCAPTTVYGAHKLMIEDWLSALTRRGDIDAISLRLPGIVARPKGPSGLKSAFLSDLFHTLAAGEEFTMPVSADATTWLMSVDCAADNVIHALTTALSTVPETRAVTLPTLHVRISDLVAEIGRQLGQSQVRIKYLPDESLERTFGAFPAINTTAAESLGFFNDRDLPMLVRKALMSTKMPPR